MAVEGRREMEGRVTDVRDEQNHVRYLQHPPQLSPRLGKKEEGRYYYTVVQKLQIFHQFAQSESILS